MTDRFNSKSLASARLNIGSNGGGQSLRSSGIEIQKASVAFDGTVIDPPPPLEGTSLAAGDTSPVTVTEIGDALQLVMPPRFLAEGVAAFAWRMRVIPSFDSTPYPGSGNDQRILLGCDWLGVGSSAISFAGGSTPFRLVHSGGSTSPAMAPPSWVAGDTVDVGFDDDRHLVIRVNGGTASISSGQGPASGGWAGYTVINLGGQPGSSYDIFPGIIYAPKTLEGADWWTV